MSSSNSVHFLDTCTETLGCESGAMCFDPEMELAAQPLSNMKGRRRRISAADTPEFPPPITTLRGQGRLRLLKKREKGKLLMFPFKPSVIEAERSSGRLLLRFLPSGAVTEQETGEEEKKEFAEKEDDGGLVFYGGGGNCARKCMVEKGEESPEKAAAAIFNGDAFWVASL